MKGVYIPGRAYQMFGETIIPTALVENTVYYLSRVDLDFLQRIEEKTMYAANGSAMYGGVEGVSEYRDGIAQIKTTKTEAFIKEAKLI